MRLQSIEIPVTDVGRAFAFYRDVLGFPPVTRSAGGAVLFLGNVHGGMVSLVRRDAPPAGDGPAMVLASDEGIEAARARMEARGVAFLGPTNHAPLGLTAYFRDTEGNRLALFDGTIRARLREQARASNDEVLARLGALRLRTRALLEGVSEEQARVPAAAGEWSISDQAGHIVDSLDSCQVVAEDLAAGRTPPTDRLLREFYPSESLAAVMADLERAFDEAEAWLRGRRWSGAAESTLVHGVFGPLTAPEWVVFTLFHVGLHLDQVEAIKVGSRQ